MILDNISPFGQLMPMMMWFVDDTGGGTDTTGGGDTTENTDTKDTDTSGSGETTTTEKVSPPEKTQFSWKDKLSDDTRNSPTVKKFDDSAEGFNKFTESHLNLERLLGHEKVPIPKGSEDTEGWSRFSEAMGIPTDPKGYSLEDHEIPEELNGHTISKDEFSQIMHANKITPGQAQNLWKSYNEISSQRFMNVKNDYTNKINETRNKLKAEWGDAYNSNVDLGKTVIDRFSGDQDTADFVTASMLQDPKGVKFLAKLGTQFAENKISGFQYKKFALSPADAQKEIDEIVSNPSHPYMNDKAPKQERDRAIAHVNSLYTIVNKKG